MAYTKLTTTKCKHCKQEFDVSDKPAGWMANHSRWCDENPKRKEYADKLKHARSCITEEARQRNNEAIKKAHADGKYEGSAKKAVETRRKNGTLRHTEEAKKKMSEIALKQTHRRLRKGCIEYKGVLLDSSWELELAKRLDELNVEWVRPDPIPWIDDEGITHNYFPDFYLPEQDLYLDPKNSQAIKVQQKKLDCLLTQYNNVVIIDSLEKCKQYETQN